MPCNPSHLDGRLVSTRETASREIPHNMWISLPIGFIPLEPYSPSDTIGPEMGCGDGGIVMQLRIVWEGADSKKRAQVMPPMGPGMEAECTALATRLEQWASEWGDPEDKTEWRLYRGGELLARQQIEGF